MVWSYLYINQRGVYGESSEACLHAFHRIIWFFELEKTLKITYFQPSCQGQGYFSPFLWDDHNSPCIFAPRKRCEDNCSLSTDTLFLPFLAYHAFVHVYLNSKGPFNSPESNSHSWLLPRAVYLYLQYNELEKNLYFYNKICCVECSPQTLHVFN